MRRLAVTVVLGVWLVWGTSGSAHECDEKHAEKLPPGPIHDRHKLMEEIGAHAKKIGDTIKAGRTSAVVPEAEAIAAKAEKITGLFPQGSTHPHSRAKLEIWQDWKKFEADATRLHKDALELAKVARENGDVGAASKQMFGACKSCHDSFRVPEDD